MIRTLYIGSSSACFEIQNNSPYYTSEEYVVRIAEKEICRGRENVFSVFNLIPETGYEAEVCFADRKETIQFVTAAESCCVDVHAFGAKGDGVNDDTVAIQTAINLLPENGRLYFPKGTYLTLPIALRSHMTLEFAEGAVLLGSTDRERYPILPGIITDESGKEIPVTGFEGIEQDTYQSLIHGSYVKDVAIIGPGRIDGNGQNGDWWKEFNNFPAKRPRAVFLNRCQDIVMNGVTVANSASWHIHPYFSQNIQLLNCFVTAPKVSPNTDAIDPESCDNVDIIGCRFSVGDDCIAVKSGKFDMAMKYHVPADHYEIRNCLMEFGHGALTLGSELSAGIRNVSVTQCLFRETDRGLRIKSRRGRGKESIITNVIFDNIRMEKVKTPIVINMWYNCVDPDRFTEYVWSREHLPVDDRTPHMGLFEFKNMECIDAEVAACYIDGLPESPIDRVEFENITISFAEDSKPGIPAMENFAKERCRLGLYLDNVREISIKNVKLNGVEGDAVIADHYETISTEESDL